MSGATLRRIDGGRSAEPVLMRLQAPGAGSTALAERVLALGARVESLPAKSMLQVQDARIRRPRYLISGWACRFRHLADGRRQIFDLVLPGDGVGVCLRPTPLANTGTVALTPVRLIDAAPLLQPEALEACPQLLPALQMQADADERRALNQIVRLGRLTALERIANLFLEIEERLAVVGLTEGDRYSMPLTQETLADLTGLSVVHVNRTLQELRRQELVRVERGWVRLLDREALGALSDYEPLVAAARG